MANEVAVSGKTEEQINAFLDKIANAMLATVKTGLSFKDDVLPGPIKLHSKAATVYERAQDDKYESDPGDRAGLGLRPGRLRGERPRPPGHHRADGRLGGRDAGHRLAPDPESTRKVPMDKIREGLLAGAAIGYLCKHNATLSRRRRAAASPRSASPRR